MQHSVCKAAIDSTLEYASTAVHLEASKTNIKILKNTSRIAKEAGASPVR